MSVYTINGQQIHVQEEGPADAPVAILIHGWCSSWYTWAPLLPALSKRFRCLAVDLPGYGNSPASDTPPTIEGYAELIAALIRTVSDRAVLVLGHSMGGQIAMTLSLRHKPLVERMVLLNPAVSGKLSTFINLFISPLILMERTPISANVVRVLERTPVGHSYTNRVLKPISFAERAVVSPEAYERIRADARRPGQGRVRAACFTAMRAGDLRGKLSGLETPALVLWGAEDNTVPLRDAGSVAAEWPAADLRLIPNAGHWPHFEQFTTTVRHISAFLGLPTLNGVHDESDERQDEQNISEVAQFLTGSDLGHEMTLPQRTRLAAQFQARHYAPAEAIASENTSGDEMYLVFQGQVEVWSMMTEGVSSPTSRRIATITAGQVVGEMALLDDRPRSADLRAGPQGVRVLTLSRQRFDALCDDDAALGQHVLRNIARALALRLRLQNWHVQLAEREFEKRLKQQRQQVAA